MCITKKATKNQPDKPSKNSKECAAKNKKAHGAKPKKKFRIPTFVKRKSTESSESKENKPLPEKEQEPVKDEKDEVKNEQEQEEVKQVEEPKVEVQKEPPRRPFINRPNCVNVTGLSGTQKKKHNKYKCGQIDREELSINNTKTEYLENAQLTKLMSHADLKVLMNGQMAAGENGDDPNCQDTVEEVDDEMQDIAFSPLLAPIQPEEQKDMANINPGDRA